MFIAFYDDLQIGCAVFCGGFLVWYAARFNIEGSETFYDELKLYAVFVFGYCGFVLGCYNALYISRFMKFIGFALAGSTVVGVIIGVIIADLIKNSDASATALVAGGWCYFGVTCWKVLHLGHYGRERKIQANWGALQNPAMMTSGQKWISTKWEEPADTANPKVTHLLEHLFAQKCVVLTPNTDIGVEVADILRKSHERWNTLTPDSLLKTAFPQAGSIFTTLLDLWAKESILQYIYHHIFVDSIL